MLITIPSILIDEYPDKIASYTGYYNMALGVGSTMGPAIASLLYHWMDYTSTLFAFGALIFFVGAATVFFLPSLDSHMDEDDDEEG